jgi:hypothetical protein
MKRRAIRRYVNAVVIILSVAVGSTACETANWGEQALKFARDEVPGLSRQSAEARLRQSWALSFETSALEIQATLQSVSDEVSELQLAHGAAVGNQKFADISSGDLEADTSVMIQGGEGLARLVDLERQVEGVPRALRELKSACENRIFFERTGLAQAGAMGMPDLAQDANWNLSVTFPSPVWFVTAFEVLFSGASVLENSEQRRLFDESVRVAKRNIVQGDELFASSRVICGEVRSELLAVFAGFESLAQELSGNVRGLTRSIHQSRQIAAKRVGLRLLERKLSDSDLGRALRDEALKIKVLKSQAQQLATRAQYRELRAEALESLDALHEARLGERVPWQCANPELQVEALRDWVSERLKFEFPEFVRKEVLEWQGELKGFEEQLIREGCQS